MSDLRRRVAVHEAGHTVADPVLGRPVEYASIREGRTFLGLAVAASGLDAAGFDPFRGVVEQPADLRADMERCIISLLAGQVAELYLVTAPAASRYTLDDGEAIARVALASLGPARRHALKGGGRGPRFLLGRLGHTHILIAG